MIYRPRWSNHLPVLVKVLRVTNGPVLELGVGMFSTPLLHWTCFYEERLLVSYENAEEWYMKHRYFRGKFHKVHFVEDWDKIDIEKKWSMAFIDHEAHRRAPETKRLANYAEYVVAHDTQPEGDHAYHYDEVYDLYKYRKDYTKAGPHISVLSNFHDLSKL